MVEEKAVASALISPLFQVQNMFFVDLVDGHGWTAEQV